MTGGPHGPERFELIVVGAGSGGLVAANFASQLGARVALVEANRIGGDCTWTGCVPSKALLKAGRVARDARMASRFGIAVGEVRPDMAAVRTHVQGAVAAVYATETPEVLAERGVEVVSGRATFTGPQSVRIGGRELRGRRILICTGAAPRSPPIDGLADVPFVTYEQIFDNDRLPTHLAVIGAGPVGLELGLAYRRLGADVTVVGPTLLPREEPEVRGVVAQQLRVEGVELLEANATSVRACRGSCRIETTAGPLGADMLLVAGGRTPRLAGLALDRAGVQATARGIRVDRFLRTTNRHVFAAGDVTGGPQFTHYAGWQAFQAVRNALLPGRSVGRRDLVPRVTFLDPEIAHVGLTEAQARATYDDATVHRWSMTRADRAVAEGETEGFAKVVARSNGRLLGATVIAVRAGELINELALALEHRLGLSDVAATIHAYPTWSTPVQQLAAHAAVDRFRTGLIGRLALRWAGVGT